MDEPQELDEELTEGLMEGLEDGLKETMVTHPFHLLDSSFAIRDFIRSILVGAMKDQNIKVPQEDQLVTLIEQGRQRVIACILQAAQRN